MQIVATFDPALASAGSFNTQLPANGKFILYNESNVGLSIVFNGGHTAYSPAWTASLYYLISNDPNVGWSQKSVLSGQTTSISQVVVEAYQPNESLNGTYPTSIQHNSFVVNPISTVAMGNTLVNQSFANQTPVVQIGTSAHTNDILINNDGTGKFSIEQAGVQHQILQMNSSGKPLFLSDPSGLDHVEVLGTLDVDGNLWECGATNLDNGAISTDGSGNLTAVAVAAKNLSSTGASTLKSVAITNNETVGGTLGVTGASSLDNGNITTDGSGVLHVDTIDTHSGAGSHIQFKVNGANSFQATSNGPNLNANMQYNLLAGSLARLSIFTGTGTGTYTHNLGATPDIVIVMTHTNGSQTVGYDSENGTTVHITCGAGLAFTALAIKRTA